MTKERRQRDPYIWEAICGNSERKSSMSSLMARLNMKFSTWVSILIFYTGNSMTMSTLRSDGKASLMLHPPTFHDNQIFDFVFEQTFQCFKMLLAFCQDTHQSQIHAGIDQLDHCQSGGLRNVESESRGQSVTEKWKTGGQGDAEGGIKRGWGERETGGQKGGRAD